MSDMRQRQASYLRSLRVGVEKHGWVVIGVMDARPPFAYTVGLWGAHQHPEVILIGPFRPETGTAILNTIGDRVKAGERFVAGRPYDDIIESRGPKDQSAATLRLVFLEVDQQAVPEFFGAALGHYSGRRFPALQAVWPDNKGRFPWEQNYHLPSGARLPLLGPPPSPGRN